MPVSAVPSAAEYLRFLPEIILSAAATLVMALEPVTGPGRKNWLAGFSFAALLAAAVAAVAAYGSPGTAFSGLLIVDGFGTLFRVLVIGVGALCVFASNPFLNREGANSGEYYALDNSYITVHARELYPCFFYAAHELTRASKSQSTTLFRLTCRNHGQLVQPMFWSTPNRRA